MFEANTIFYPPYLLSAFLISLIWLKSNTELTWRDSFRFYFKKEIWLNRGALLDLIFCLFIILLMRRLLSPLEDWIFFNQLKFLTKWLGPPWTFKLPAFYESLLATLITMIAIDFSTYLIHRLMHSNRLLWSTHKFHHGLKSLNFMSAHRQNPFEFIILNIARTLFAALALSLFHWFFPSNNPVITVQGIGAGFFIYMFTVNLHHSHIPVRYPKYVRFILISPHIHQLHHSKDPKHFGKNYGVVFSIWDRIFGTYLDEEVKVGELRFGLDSSPPSRLN